MKPKTGASKINISMPRELFEYLEKAEQEHNANPANLHCPTDRSKLIQKAIRDMMEQDMKSSTAKRGQAMPDYALNDDPIQPPGASAKIVVPSSGTSAGGYLTRRQANSRKAGKAK